MSVADALRERLTDAVARAADVERELADADTARDAKRLAELAREHHRLAAVVETNRRLESAEREIEGARELAASDDAEMAAEARAEVDRLEAEITTLERALRPLLIPRDPLDDRPCIVEIRAGTGGDEAALFAADLFRMYTRYVERRGWRVEPMSLSDGTLGGLKEAIFKVAGDGAFGALRHESGVHRVQRVPATEAQGRIHTSAATVAVLPEAEEVDIAIDERDLKIDVYRSSGAGGQHVNKTDSAVRITHLPTGIVVTSSEKSQHQNRARALKVLQARLYEMQREQLDTARAESRKSQVGSGDRSERIRTYNFPQGRVTDHRINLTVYNLPKVLEGEALDDIIDPLIAEDQAARLAALEDELA